MKTIVEFSQVSKNFEYSRGGPRDLKHHLIRVFQPSKFREMRHSRIVLDEVSFRITEGEVVGVMGRNGVGKSTLLKIISGIYQPNQGSVQVNGRMAPVLELGAGFADELSGYDNIFLNSSILGFSRSESERNVQRIIDFSELGDQIHDSVRNYSSGMLVRLAFSIACHLDAQLLLFDEVMAVGDLGFQNKCMQKIGELNKQGASIILVSHSPDQIVATCGRCLLIDNGHIVYDGPAQKGAERYRELFT